MNIKQNANEIVTVLMKLHRSYRRTDAPGGAPVRADIRGGGEPKPMSGSCVNLKP